MSLIRLSLDPVCTGFVFLIWWKFNDDADARHPQNCGKPQNMADL